MKYNIGDEVGIYPLHMQGKLVKGTVVHTFEPNPGNELYIIELPTSIDAIYEVCSDMELRAPPPKEPLPEEFNFRARVTLEGVDIGVMAFSEEEALEMAKDGKWEYCDYETAERIDWKIRK